MPELEYIRVNEVPNKNLIKEGQIRTIRARGKNLYLTRLNDRFYAGNAQCPHAKGPLNKGFCTKEGTIVCPWHRFEFDLQTGKNTSGEGYFIQTYPVIEKGNVLYIGFPKKKWWEW